MASIAHVKDGLVQVADEVDGIAGRVRVLDDELQRSHALLVALFAGAGNQLVMRATAQAQQGRQRVAEAAVLLQQASTAVQAYGKALG